jgi:surfeit locus 1 family protein
VLIGLGFWQLDRARQKRELIAAFEQGGGEAQTLDQALARGLDAALYRHVRVEGHYEGARQFLLDGQIVGEGQIGYDVLTPFVLDGGRGTILVNRGFVQQDANRRPMSASRGRANAACRGASRTCRAASLTRRRGTQTWRA